MRARDLVTGISALALGIVAVSLAALEYHVSLEISAAGRSGAITGIAEMTFGTAAYILAYLAAGGILLALGVWKIRRARRES